MLRCVNFDYFLASSLLLLFIDISHNYVFLRCIFCDAFYCDVSGCFHLFELNLVEKVNLTSCSTMTPKFYGGETI